MPKKTKTSSFGSPGRIGHDASAFYGGRLYDDQPKPKDIEYAETPLPPGALDRIFNTLLNA